MNFLASYAAFADYRYWLNPFPIPLGPTLVAQIFAFFAFFVVAAVVLRVLAHMIRKQDALRSDLLRRFWRPLVWTGALGWMFLFFTYEQAPLLGMRFWFLLIVAFFLVWLGMAAWYAAREYPARREEEKEKRAFTQYLPHHER